MSVVAVPEVRDCLEVRRAPRVAESRPTAQLEGAARRALHLSPQAMSLRMIAVTSGKGGVGKSNISANLASLLARSGVKVALIDADWGQGNLDVLLGVSAKRSVSEVLSGEHSLWSVMQTLPHSLRLAAGSSGPIRSVGSPMQALAEGGLMDVCGDHDMTILDCGSGIGSDVIDVCLLCGHVLVVTTPEPTAMTDAYGLIKCLHRAGQKGRISVLVNMAANSQEAKATFFRLSRVAAKFLGQTLFDAGYVLADEKVPLAVRKRQPFVRAYPGCDASKCMAALMMKLRPKGCQAAVKESWHRKLIRVLSMG